LPGRGGCGGRGRGEPLRDRRSCRRRSPARAEAASGEPAEGQRFGRR